MNKILIATALLLLIGIVAADVPYGRGPGMMFGASGYTDSQLTNEQRATIRARVRELWESGATHFDIMTEVQKLLKEFGIDTATTGYGPGYGRMGGGMMGGGYGQGTCPGHNGGGMMGGSW